MKYFKINRALEVVAVSDEYPAECHDNPDAWWIKRDGSRGEGWANRWDIDGMPLAQQLADSASRLMGRLYIAIDKGERFSPRYGVIAAPAIGDEVSRGFNGDYYPCGRVVSISKSLRLIVTESGKKFYRRGQSGTWLHDGMWGLVPGVRDEWNREF